MHSLALRSWPILLTTGLTATVAVGLKSLSLPVLVGVTLGLTGMHVGIRWLVARSDEEEASLFATLAKPRQMIEPRAPTETSPMHGVVSALLGPATLLAAPLMALVMFITQLPVAQALLEARTGAGPTQPTVGRSLQEPAGADQTLTLSTTATVMATATPQLTATPTARPTATQAGIIVVQRGESIQDALDQAEPGQTVRVAAGGYDEGPGETLRLKPGVRLIGSGRGQTVLNGPNAPSPVPAPAVLGADDATLEGFTIQATLGLVLDGVTGMAVRDTAVFAEDTALRIQGGAQENVIDGNLLHVVTKWDTLGRNALQVSRSHRNTFRDNRFRGQSVLFSSSENTFAGDFFRGRHDETAPTEALELNASRDNRFNFATFYSPFERTIGVHNDGGGNIIANSIIAGGREDVRRVDVVESESAPLLRYTLVDRELLDERVALGESVIFADPQFNGDFSLHHDSPAIDVGDPAARSDPDGTRADLGAIPFDRREHLGDVNLDGRVDSNDALVVLQHGAWVLRLLPEQHAVADVNGDGAVTAFDAALILQQEAELLLDVLLGESIQDALNRAAPGQTVWVAAGEHSGPQGETLMLKPRVRLVGAGVGKTIYRPTARPSPPGMPPVSVFQTAVAGADGATIEAMTIHGFYPGLILHGVTDMTVREIEVSAGLVAVGLSGGATRNVIEGITADGGRYGHPLSLRSVSGNTIRNSRFFGESVITGSSHNTLERNVFVGTRSEEHVSPTTALALVESRDNQIAFSTLYAPANRTIAVRNDEGGNTISNSIIAGGIDVLFTGQDVLRIIVVEGDSAPLVQWTLVDRKLLDERVAVGEGVIVGDPWFADPDNSDFSLKPDSPAIDAGDRASPPDRDGTRADLGAIPFDQEQLQLVVRGNREVAVGGTLVLQIGAFDPQGDPLGFMLEDPLPENTQFLPLGDVSLDGSVRSADAALILEHAAGLLDLDAHREQRALADMNADGTVNATDAGLVLQREAGLLPPLAEHRFLWTPTLGQLGSHGFTFTVSDGTHTASETIQIVVGPRQVGAPQDLQATYDPRRGVVELTWTNTAEDSHGILLTRERFDPEQGEITELVEVELSPETERYTDDDIERDELYIYSVAAFHQDPSGLIESSQPATTRVTTSPNTP